MIIRTVFALVTGAPVVAVGITWTVKDTFVRFSGAI